MPGRIEMSRRVAVMLIALLLAAGVAAKSARRETIPLKKSFAFFPMEIEQWRGVPQPAFEDDTLAALGVDDYLARVYVDRRRSAVGLYVGYWKSQRQGDAVHSPQNCLPGAGWQIVSRTRISPDDPSQPLSRDLEINRTVIQKGRQRQLVLYWYQSQGRIVASEYWSKIFLVADAIRRNRTDGAVVRIMTPITDADSNRLPLQDERNAERLALDFTALILPRLTDFLPQ